MKVSPSSHNDEPVYWFVVLVKSLEASRLNDAAHAQQELERLGFKVQRCRGRKQNQILRGGNQ